MILSNLLHSLRSRSQSVFLTHHFTCYTLLLAKMAHFQFSNVIIQGGTFSSMAAQAGNNKDSESGMHDFKSVLKSSLIDDPMKDFIPETRSFSWSDT